MGLNIKKPSTEAAIRELAARTGESLTDAVESAVLEKLDQLRAAAQPDTFGAMLARLRPLQAALKAKQIDPADSRTGAELADDLYDEHGLPK
ncbi:MAG: type II toxin-antitoxin system VapB family antitoxin [Alphaproteobacteria bacterium]|nr:type II toxin-antitoxin system VapB family antitoxin [Alphaproteobacteria bacterium]MBL7099703.1 type II toxin-antitoxin system VapB family antitoxin [Alphaproteobacteria bacterium]